MLNMFSSYGDFDFSVLDHYDHQTRDLRRGNEGIFEQGCEEVDLSFGGECNWEELGDICSDYGLYEEHNSSNKVFSSENHHQQQQQQQQQTPFFDREMIDDFQLRMASPSPLVQMPQDLEYGNVDCIPAEIQDQEFNKEESQVSSLTLMELLKSAFPKKINGGRLVMSEKCCNEKASISYSNNEFQRLSTEEVMRVAGALLLQFNEQNGNNVDVAMLMQPFSCDRIGLAKEENNDVELARLLIAAAEKVGNKQFDQASKLLTKCDYLSSTTGTPVQRVVYQFGEALRERINRQTGRIPIEDYFLQERIHLEYVEEEMMSPNSALLACYQLLPFCKVLNFAGIQAVIDNIASAKKVHFIQIGIKIGMECSILMQALVTRRGVSLEHFKLTTIVTRNQKKVEETGKRLASFADSMNIPFIFNVIGLSDMKDIKEELFSREENEVVAVYCPFVLRTMIPWPDQLETLIRVIRKLHPCVMVVYEVEGNHNSPLFVNRFIESLFFYSAFFDCLEECMDRDNQDRINIEINYFGQGILNVVAAEGEERVVRHVGIDVWRSFFSRFGLVETELSYSSIYQANLVNKQFACANSCTLGMNGKSLTVGWKGTPIHSLSIWKFRNV